MLISVRNGGFFQNIIFSLLQLQSEHPTTCLPTFIRTLQDCLWRLCSQKIKQKMHTQKKQFRGVCPLVEKQTTASVDTTGLMPSTQPKGSFKMIWTSQQTVLLKISNFSFFVISLKQMFYWSMYFFFVYIYSCKTAEQNVFAKDYASFSTRKQPSAS